MTGRRPLAAVATAGVLTAVALAGCGSTQTAVSKPGPRLGKADAFCERTLKEVRTATNFDTIDALNDTQLSRTAQALRRVSAKLHSGDRNERLVASAADQAAAGIDRYVRSDLNDTAAGTTTFHDMYAGLVDLDQIAGNHGLPACGLNTEA